MLKHVIDIFTNTYYIYENDNLVFSIELKNNEVDIRGCVNTYKGDIKELKLENKTTKEMLGS